MHLNVTKFSVGIPKEKSASNTFLFKRITKIYHKSAGLQVCSLRLSHTGNLPGPISVFGDKIVSTKVNFC